MKKSTLIKGFTIIIIVIVMVMSGKLLETNEKGNYQIKQAAISGKMSARMTPGTYGQIFGDIDTWPKAETFFFTIDRDTEDDIDEDTSMEVQFVDGSLCKISGTLRINLPTTESDAVGIVTTLGYKTYNDVQEKLIRPTVRNVLRSTANLMSAQESYSTRRPDFIAYSRLQIQHGLFETEDEVREIIDLVSGEKLKKVFKVIKRDKSGNPMYQPNPIEGTGITLANFEIKDFDYEPKVKDQIAEQQKALMAVQTAKANAALAEQNKITIEATGKANVAQAQYREMEQKAVAVVQADRDKEIALIEASKKKEMEQIAKEEAIIKASKKLEVATLDAKSAEQEKLADILRGEGEAGRKKLVMAADGQLEMRLNAWLQAQQYYANAMGKHRLVPDVQMGGNGSDGESNAAANLIQMMSVKTAQDLALDLKMKNSENQ